MIRICYTNFATVTIRYLIGVYYLNYYLILCNACAMHVQQSVVPTELNRGKCRLSCWVCGGPYRAAVS